MKGEEALFDKIMDFAQRDVRVRAVYMNGSRANPNAPVDPYRDFDIVYVVRDFEDFKRDHSWIDGFGERLILQMPEAMRYPSGQGHFNWMMLFVDGNRLDLTLLPIEMPELIERDSATVVLLDKDGLLPDFGAASDADYVVAAPDDLFYYSCCNNFFWCLQNVAKGLVRDELPYALGMYYEVVLPELNDMVRWYIGSQNKYSVAPGKFGKYFKQYLSVDLYNRYLEAYGVSTDGMISRGMIGGGLGQQLSETAPTALLWHAVEVAVELFRELAKAVAKDLGYTYNTAEDEGMKRYLEMMKAQNNK